MLLPELGHNWEVDGPWGIWAMDFGLLTLIPDCKDSARGQTWNFHELQQHWG